MDYLRGLKENVIVGRLIPAGTGLAKYHDFHMEDVVYEDDLEGDEELLFDFSEGEIRALPQEVAESE